MSDTSSETRAPVGCAGRSLCRFLYASRLAPGQPPATVGTLLTLARERNRQLGVSGALLFDGEHFVQLLEGPADDVDALAQRIQADARHTDVQVLLHGADAGTPLFQRWWSGWADADAVQAFLALDRADPVRLLAAFRQLVRDEGDMH